jgi:hypothetical protein
MPRHVCAHAVAGNNLCIPLVATTLNRRTVKARVASNATMLRFYVQGQESANTDSMVINNRALLLQKHGHARLLIPQFLFVQCMCWSAAAPAVEGQLRTSRNM